MPTETVSKGLATDANILVASLFGNRVQGILKKYHGVAHICAPASCFEEAQRNAVVIGRRRRADRSETQTAIDHLHLMVEPVEMHVLARFEQAARLRIPRDLTDWPVIALAMARDFPIWTQDQDFFGCGIATWTTDRVEIYLQQPFDSGDSPGRAALEA